MQVLRDLNDLVAKGCTRRMSPKHFYNYISMESDRFFAASSLPTTLLREPVDLHNPLVPILPTFNSFYFGKRFTLKSPLTDL
ncbi:hypothetical protein Syun_025204 [Stephania yunnanensis]|uniref:Uncharacterized protein n=1 Tax=Stephania yunnanensis TaxID=152371 RepID=A0AAP0HUP2_9MAGN